MKTVKRPGLEYNLLEDGIHEFIFTGEEEGGVDHFFEILKGLLEATPPDTVLRYLVDARNTRRGGGVGELVKRFRKLEVQVGERAAGRTAILHDGSLLLTFANTFIDTLAPSQDRTRFFEYKNRDEALRWLRSV